MLPRDDFAELPSIKGLIDDIVDDLRSNINVILLLPATLEPHVVWDWIHDRLYRNNFSSHCLDIDEDSPMPKNAVHIWQMEYMSNADSTVESNRSDNKLLSDVWHNGNSSNVIVLNNITSLGEERASEWLRIIGAASQEMRSLQESMPERHALCVIDHAHTLLDHLPATDKNLKHYYWWGFPSANELRSLCRIASSGDDSYEAWLECIVAGVGAGEVSLAEFLLSAEAIPDLDRLVELLQEYGSAKVLTSEEQPFSSLSDILSSIKCGVNPPFNIMSDWANGAIISSHEHGMELHPSLLAQRKHLRKIELRVWRAQLTRLMPMVDKLRVWSGEKFTQNMTRGWFEEYKDEKMKPRDEERLRANSFDGEIGFMRHVARNNYELRNVPGMLNRLKIVDDIRDKLAHYQPVTKRDFDRLWRETDI